MTKAANLALPNGLPRTYAALVALHAPRPIHDEVSYDNTVHIVDALAGHRLNQDQEDYLDILSQMIEAYDDQHVEIPEATGVELIRLLLEENEMTGDDLAKLLGVDRSVAYKILKGTRNLTTEHVRKLSERFAVSADALLR